jgi:hypothetical protein
VDPALSALLAPLIGAMTTFILMAANYYFNPRNKRDDDPADNEEDA